VLINVVCPHCGINYHLQEEMRGKPMRCQNVKCHHVFVIGNAEPAPPRPDQELGHVGDLIPLLPSRSETPEPAAPHVSDVLEMLPARAEVASGWLEPPPVRRQAPSEAPAPDPVPPKKPKPKTKVPKEKPAVNGPRVVAPGGWDAPPVRRDKEPEGPTPPPTSEAEPEVRPARDEPPVEDVPKPRGKWARWAIISFAASAVLVLGVGGVVLWVVLANAEKRLAAEADAAYASELFRKAGDTYAKLAEKYPESEQVDRYRFRKDLSALRLETTDPPPDIGDILEHFREFLEERDKDPLLPEHGADLGSSLVKLVTGFADKEADGLTDDTPIKTLDQAIPIVASAKKIKLPKGTAAPEWAKVDESFARVRAVLARLKERQRILADLRKLLDTPGYPAILASERLIAKESASFPGLAKDPQVEEIVAKLYDAHKASVRYVPAGRYKEPGTLPANPPGDRDEPSILFNPLLTGSPGVPGPEDPVALALVRGVLYAKSVTNGEVRWAVRVGIDTTALPVRVPATASAPEIILVLSSDDATLTARDVQGPPLWRYPLGAAVLGKPVVVDRRAYLATYSGEVHEIELNEGKLLGRYLLGQRLTLGGSHEPGTRRIFFPADAGCVYVLDVAKQECQQIVYSRHPSGSLRGEPVVVPPESEDSPGYVALTQTDGFDRVRMRVWEMTGKDRKLTEKILKTGVALAGWTWFSPSHDAEKIVLVSDAGVLGMVGIRQALNFDEALFPLLPGGGIDLGALLGLSGERRARNRGRAEVAQVQGDDLWVTAHGRMMRLRMGWGPTLGPRMVPAWPAPLDVGSPIHASQVFDNALGRSSMVLVTQPQRRSCAWVSRIENATGSLLWRRQLGLVCTREPVAIPRPGGEPIWLAVDQGGGLFGLDAGRYPVRPGARWLSDSKMRPLADSLPENANQPPHVLPSEDGKTVHVLAFPGNGLEMIVREVDSAGPMGALQVKVCKVALQHKLAGEPTRVGDHILLPLADGTLGRLTVPIDPAMPNFESGLPWRAERAGTEALGFVVGVGPGRFVTSDGAGGLAAWEWKPKNPVWQALPTGRANDPTLSLKARITGMVRVPGKEVLLAVSDAAGKVTLVEVKANGAMVVPRSWDMKGQVTTGPFVRTAGGAARIGCIVDRSRLVWIDPAIEKILWDYPTPAKDAIVGIPHLADDLVVIADQGGRYIGIIEKTGIQAGKGYQLRGSIAAVASPVPFQKNRLLAPLSDGTMMLLSVGKLREK
jgi:PQQ-like domain